MRFGILCWFLYTKLWNNLYSYPLCCSRYQPKGALFAKKNEANMRRGRTKNFNHSSKSCTHLKNPGYEHGYYSNTVTHHHLTTHLLFLYLVHLPLHTCWTCTHKSKQTKCRMHIMQTETDIHTHTPPKDPYTPSKIIFTPKHNTSSKYVTIA